MSYCPCCLKNRDWKITVNLGNNPVIQFGYLVIEKPAKFYCHGQDWTSNLNIFSRSINFKSNISAGMSLRCRALQQHYLSHCTALGFQVQTVLTLTLFVSDLSRHKQEMRWQLSRQQVLQMSRADGIIGRMTSFVCDFQNRYEALKIKMFF